jgi:hypothetical protein
MATPDTLPEAVLFWSDQEIGALLNELPSAAERDFAEGVVRLGNLTLHGARLYHAHRRAEGVPEHKFWSFEYCPAAVCVNARCTLADTRRLLRKMILERTKAPAP